MHLEIWFLILLGAVIVMAEIVRMARRSSSGPAGRRGSARTPGGRKVRRHASRAGANYRLAPRDPEVMAGAMFDLMAEILNYDQMSSFAEFVASPELTDRYVARLAGRQSTRAVADKLAFFNEAMEANGFTAEDRVRLSRALQRRAEKQYKLLEIHKNLDKIL